ncbi:MAG: SMP-30/gluconolactonase/LRE family protein, partial [Chitinophagaceae bacterium]
GNIIACADENNELWEISISKKTKILLTDFEGKKLNGPNDLWIDGAGGIYFTDPYYQRDYWTRTKPEQPGRYLYYFERATKKITIVDTAFTQPNGIIGSSDGKYLYVADIGASKTYRYNIDGNGRLSNRVLFVDQGSDGMTLDNKGNLYLTGKGVTIYDPSGKKIMNIPVPESWTGNVCFGGKDKNILFITASKSVFTLKMRVKGNL